MRVIITGGSGLIGRALTANLAADGHEVIILSRSPGRVSGLPPSARAVGWDTRSADGWGEWADGAHAIVNLAGDSIAGDNFFPSRWTAEKRHQIRQSRLEAGQAVVQAVEQAEEKPRVVVQSSAIGHYGSDREQTFTEESAPGSDFLADVTQEWEASTAGVEAYGVRRAIARTGIVLSPRGGTLPRLLLPYRFFVGGPFGSGRQWWSWIHLKDEARALRYLLDEEGASGPFNLTAPNPVQNDTFGQTLAEVLGRPHLLPVPAFAMRAIFGDVATVVVDGQRVLPQRLLELGFSFQYPRLEPALRALLHDEVPAAA